MKNNKISINAQNKIKLMMPIEYLFLSVSLNNNATQYLHTKHAQQGDRHVTYPFFSFIKTTQTETGSLKC